MRRSRTSWGCDASPSLADRQWAVVSRCLQPAPEAGVVSTVGGWRRCAAREIVGVEAGDPKLDDLIGAEAAEQLREEVELVVEAGDRFDLGAYLKGIRPPSSSARR